MMECGKYPPSVNESTLRRLVVVAFVTYKPHTLSVSIARHLKDSA